jgi:hypothetical protein
MKVPLSVETVENARNTGSTSSQVFEASNGTSKNVVISKSSL